MKKHLVESIIKDTAATYKRINGISKGKSVDEAQLALTKEILALGQSLIQLEAVDEKVFERSLEVMGQADKGPMVLARYAMRLAREVGNNSLTEAQINKTIFVIEMVGSLEDQ